MRRLVSVLAATFAMAAATLAVAPAASAAGSYGCSGSLIDSYPIQHASSTWGTAYLYYDSSTGNNCAAAVKNSNGYRGTDTLTTVYMQRCSSTTPGTCGSIEASDNDSGQYSYYAGPAVVYAAGHCVQVTASIWDPSHSDVATTVQNGVHCG